MEQQQYNTLFSFLWNIANDVLVQAFDPSEYKKITLPFIVLRRLDLLLEDTKEQVLNFCKSEEFKNLPEESQEQQLYIITGHPFFNTSGFSMTTLKAERIPHVFTRTSWRIWMALAVMYRILLRSLTCVTMQSAFLH